MPVDLLEQLVLLRQGGSEAIRRSRSFFIEQINHPDALRLGFVA